MMLAGSTLVIRPGAIGDAILTLPALELLLAGGAQPLTVLGTPASWRFVPHGSDEIRVMDFSSAEWLGIFSDQAAVSTRAASLLAQTKLAVVFLAGATQAIERRLKKFGVGEVLVIEPPLAAQKKSSCVAQSQRAVRWFENALPPEHAARRLLEPLKAIFAPNAGLGNKVRSINLCPSIEGRKTEINHLESTTRSYGFKTLIALHPGSGGKKKCWPAVHFAQLAKLIIKELNALPVAFFGPADANTHDEYFAALGPKFPYCGLEDYPLHEVFVMLEQCKMAICNDSGMAHLAARATQTLALFGPTDPAEWAPVGGQVWTLQAPGNDMRALTVDEVFALSARIFKTQDKL